VTENNMSLAICGMSPSLEHVVAMNYSRILKPLHLQVRSRVLYTAASNPHWTCITVHSVQLISESSRRPRPRSADTADYIKRRTRTKLGERCFSHAGPAAWNSLPDSIDLTTDTNRW